MLQRLARQNFEDRFFAISMRAKATGAAGTRAYLPQPILAPAREPDVFL